MFAPEIDPVAIHLGPLRVHWYGLMYLAGFAAFWWLGTRRARRPGATWREEEVGDFLFYGALGVILGGRLGYVLFYNLEHFLHHPLEIFAIWTGGMSFHGGLLGVITAMAYFAHKMKKGFFGIADFVAPLVPPGLGFVRLGNFINQELWGRTTDLPWGVIFRSAGPLPRHPSQLYEAVLEGAVLFVILWWYTRNPRPRGAVAGLFLVGYGTFRFLIEFAREPDAHLGFIALDWLTMGQILSLPMIALGIWLVSRRASLKDYSGLI